MDFQETTAWKMAECEESTEQPKRKGDVVFLSSLLINKGEFTTVELNTWSHGSVRFLSRAKPRGNNMGVPYGFRISKVTVKDIRLFD